MAEKDENGYIYPSIEGVTADVVEILQMGLDMGSWYSYERDGDTGIKVTSYDGTGEPDKYYYVSIDVGLA